MLIPRPRFPIVALFAKRLPVILVPKQHLVSPVRPDVIDHGCQGNYSCTFALDAKMVICQELLPCHLPAMAVAAFKCAGPITGVKLGMKLAILVASQTRAAEMLARFLGLHWHVRQPPLRKEKTLKAFVLQGFSAFYDSPMI